MVCKVFSFEWGYRCLVGVGVVGGYTGFEFVDFRVWVSSFYSVFFS